MTFAQRFIFAAATMSLVAVPAAAQTTFKRDPAITRAIQDKLVAATRASDPSVADQLAKAFSTDIIKSVAPAFRPFGFTTDDAVDMTAVYWVSAWEAANGQVGVQTDPALARGARAQLAKIVAPKLAGQPDAVKQEIADMMLIQALSVDARMKAAKQQGGSALRSVSDAVHSEAQSLIKTDMRQVDLTPQGFKPKNVAADPGPNKSARGGAGSAAAGRTGSVAGYYFRSIYGMGGAIDFEPLAFFGNGDYVELDQTSVADLDVAADKAKSPKRWGKWRKQGNTFLLTSSDGRTNDYQLGSASFFPAFTAAQGPTLSGVYKNTSGGGDYAMGGSVSTLSVNTLNFLPDGRFTDGTSSGGIASNAAIGSRRQSGGKWRLDGSTLELTYADGRRVRTSFLWGAKGTPPRPAPNMVFIGGDVFLKER